MCIDISIEESITALPRPETCTLRIEKVFYPHLGFPKRKIHNKQLFVTILHQCKVVGLVSGLLISTILPC